MQYYVGLDVSLKETHMCVRVPGGRVAASGCVESCPVAIAAWLGERAPGAEAVVLETDLSPFFPAFKSRARSGFGPNGLAAQWGGEWSPHSAQAIRPIAWQTRQGFGCSGSNGAGSGYSLRANRQARLWLRPAM